MPQRCPLASCDGNMRIANQSSGNVGNARDFSRRSLLRSGDPNDVIKSFRRADPILKLPFAGGIYTDLYIRD
ncbi:hypothetical protein JTE90_029167 [Oedothorax gibbosus]|uniref:Uncharacterized protein n=1 Tax=Oedothorax gibbosus TaxID=931172 RepID=A0AAV6VGW5_9ARAC|nr:hypothetical protein JTE90_029167 [Oedothorax gibbosus]